MNVADSHWLSLALERKGHQPVEQDELADFVLLNTCSVREKPFQKVYSEIGRYKAVWEKNKLFFVGVGGCVAQQVGEDFWPKFPYVRLVFGTDGCWQVPGQIDLLLTQPELRISLLDFAPVYPEKPRVFPDRSQPSAFITIMQGCDNFCAYCIVPLVRGPQKSRFKSNILAEARAWVERGAKELVLLGQNVNSYGQDKYGDGTSFVELLDEISAIQGLKRLRFTTSHPKDLSLDLIELFAQKEVLSPQLHLPLQSGSSKILAKMGRKYDRKKYLDLIRRLKQARPEMAFSTDVIVGFPGESEADFRQTLDVLTEVEFENVYVFKYNDRPGTAASKLTNKVEEEVKQERLLRLLEVQKFIRQKLYQRQVGKILEVLVEGQTSQVDVWRGRDNWNRVVNFKVNGAQLDKLLTDLVQVKITAAKKNSLWGELCL